MKSIQTSLRSALFKLASLTASVFAFAGLASAQSIISVNIRNSTATAATNVTTAFGVAAENSVVGNWTNTSSFGAGAPTNNLIDSASVITGVSVTMLNPAGMTQYAAGLNNTPWVYGLAQFLASTSTNSITFNNLNAWAPNGYYALVYVNGALANTGARITDGTTSYYFKAPNPVTTSPVLITTNIDPGAGNYTAGNYAKFGTSSAPLTGNSVTFSIPFNSISGASAIIGGVQLIAIPEPSTIALLAGAGVLLIGIVRRRRNG